MGDRCWIQMTFRKEDQAKFEQILGDCWDDIVEENGIITANAYDANYGFYSEREELAKAGLTFDGQHGAGGNYGDGIFACHKGKHAEINADSNGNSMIAIDIETGEISKTDLDIFYNYRRVYLDAKKYIEGEK